jgi:hypothetical protein
MGPKTGIDADERSVLFLSGIEAWSPGAWPDDIVAEG